MKDFVKLLMAKNSWRLYNSIHTSIEIDGIRIPIVSGTGLNLVDSVRRDDDVKITMQKVLKFKEGIVIDVGANVGVALLCLLSIDRKRKYVGFEPNISSAYVIEQIIKLNSLSDHYIIPVGLSDKTEIASFKYNYSTDVSGTVKEGFRPNGMYCYEKKVILQRGDELIGDQKFNNISMIKIDVEGAEVEVLRGLRNSIKKYRPFVIFESSGYEHIEKGTYNARYFGDMSQSEKRDIIKHRKKTKYDIDKEFTTYGYNIIKIKDDGMFEIVDSVDQPSDRANQNYLAVPKELFARFAEQNLVHVENR